jgi:diadenosine tetraphosphatase ApaH/serine/threonine PP2A family protein phosphatase
MVMIKDFTGSLDTIPFNFSHFNLNHLTLYYYGRPIPAMGFPLDMRHEKTSVSDYNTLFKGSGIRHSNAGLQVTQSMLIAGYFMLMFVLTPDRPASEGHISLPDQGNIRDELQFVKPLSEAITCLLYL